MYASWPKVVSRNERALVALSYGHRYDLEPVDDSNSDTMLVLSKDGEPIADIALDRGRVADFCVSADLVAIATVEPAGLYLCRNWKESQVLYLKIPLEDQSLSAASDVTIGNYGSNILVAWHGPEPGPVYVGMVSGKDAFRFDYKVLRYYNEKGQLRTYLRTEGEHVLAIPHFPRQMGVICTLSNNGVKFYSLRPFYTINKLSDELSDSPLIYNMGIAEPPLYAVPSRIQFDAYTMTVRINGKHLAMKYDPMEQIDTINKEWVKIIIDGVEIGPKDTIFMTPFETDKNLQVQAVESLGAIEIEADLPVSFRLASQTPTEALPQLGIGYLMKGQKTDILMTPMQCFTPFAMARFVEKFNVKIRAEVWS